jgi:gamma-glutamyltranspeptidase/glutathione hydrolase
VVDELRSRGGSLGAEDLRAHETGEVDPLSVELDGCTLLEQPPVSQGVMVSAMMLALEEADRRGWRIEGDAPRATVREHHLQVEIYRRVREYRDRFLVDPRFADEKQSWRLTHWLSRKHAGGTCDRLRPDRVVPWPAPDAHDDLGDTTYLCVADSGGNIVSWIQSIFHPFGAGFLVPGTGILLNNRMAGFSMDPESPNRLAPGKKPVHTLNSWMVLRDAKPWMVGGTPGAERQIQTNVQVLRGRLARGVALAEAIRAPRWMLDENDRVAIEGRGPAEVRRRLKDRGHAIVRIGPWDASGLVQAIESLEAGGWLACTDPRGEGLAAGF